MAVSMLRMAAHHGLAVAAARGAHPLAATPLLEASLTTGYRAATLVGRGAATRPLNTLIPQKALDALQTVAFARNGSCTVGVASASRSIVRGGLGAPPFSATRRSFSVDGRSAAKGPTAEELQALRLDPLGQQEEAKQAMDKLMAGALAAGRATVAASAPVSNAHGLPPTRRLRLRFWLGVGGTVPPGGRRRGRPYSHLRIEVLCRKMMTRIWSRADRTRFLPGPILTTGSRSTYYYVRGVCLVYGTGGIISLFLMCVVIVVEPLFSS